MNKPLSRRTLLQGGSATLALSGTALAMLPRMLLAEDAATRSTTSVCLKIVDPWFRGLAEPAQQEVAKQLAAALESEGVGFDLGAYRDAPPGLRIWCGATVEASDVALLTQWIDWAFAETKAALPKAA